MSAFCKVDFAKCIFYYFFSQNICVYQKDVVSLHRNKVKYTLC